MRGLAMLGLALLALLSLTNAFAMGGASSDGSGMTISITTTNAAIIGLAPGPTGPGTGNAASTAYYFDTNKVLRVDFRRGRNAVASYAFPVKASGGLKNTFEYRNLFEVINNSDATQCVWVYVPAGGPTDLTQIRLGGTVVAGPAGSWVTCQNISPGASAFVDVRWEIDSTTGVSGDSFAIRVGTGTGTP